MNQSVYWLPFTAQQLNEPPGTIVIGSPGSGKACWDEENIVTPNGLKKIKDIQVGDFLFGKNGQLTKVTGVFPQGKKQLYKVILADNRSLICSGNHRFTVGYISHGKEKWETLTVEEILKKDFNNKRHKVFIQNNDCLTYPKKLFKVHPYIIGAFLGDGVKTSGVLEFSSETAEIPNKIAKLLSIDLKQEILAKKNKHNYSWNFYYKDINRGTTNKLVWGKDLDSSLINLLTNTYSYNKYIPDEYKYCSEEQRYQLIQGLLDTDGTIGLGPRYNISFGTNSEQLANDVCEVIRSLGNFYTKIRTPRSKYYNIFISCKAENKENLFSLQRKKERAIAAKSVKKTWYRHYDRLNIIDIEKLDLIDNCTCFTVDAKDHQFIAGETVVTHNTFFLVNTALNCLSIGQKIIAIDPKNDFVKLTNIYDIPVIDINNIQEGELNPFTFLTTCDETTLLTLIELICGSLDKSTINIITPIIKDFITEFKRDKKYIDMQTVANYLFSKDSIDAQNVGSLLKLHETSKYGKLLFTSKTNVKPLVLDNTKSVIISLLGMKFPDPSKTIAEYTPEERFTSAIIYLICKKLYEILSTKNIIPVNLFIDEAYVAYSNEEMGNVINEFLRLGRSLNTAVILASQGISHFPSKIEQYISSKFMFKSNSVEEITKFIELFDRSQLDRTLAIDNNVTIDTVTSFETGQCLFIDRKNRSGFIKIQSIWDPSLLTSNPYGKIYE